MPEICSWALHLNYNRMLQFYINKEIRYMITLFRAVCEAFLKRNINVLVTFRQKYRCQSLSQIHWQASLMEWKGELLLLLTVLSCDNWPSCNFLGWVSNIHFFAEPLFLIINTTCQLNDLFKIQKQIVEILFMLVMISFSEHFLQYRNNLFLLPSLFSTHFL